MKIVYLAEAKSGLRWFHRYYKIAFPEGEKNAQKQYKVMKAVLLSNPNAGHPVGARNSRMYSMPKTPFAIIYRVVGNRIEVMSIHDQRSESFPDDI